MTHIKKHHKTKIIQISSFLPPIGGVSIFLQRLKYYTDLLSEKEIYYVDVSGINVKEKKSKGIHCISKIGIIPYLFREKPAYIVFHSNSAPHLIINLLFARKHRFIYFAHGESILKEKNRKGWRYRVLSKAECIVCPTENIYLAVKNIFPDTAVKNISFVILPKGIQPLQERSLELLRGKTDYVFSSYANNLRDYNGVNIYGVDMMIDALYRLRMDGYSCGIVLLMSCITDKNKFQEYMNRISELELNEYFVVLDQPINEASRLYVGTDAYLRPTNTDANAFSIYEALSLGVPVLASDAVPRAEGCLTFQNRNTEDFVEKIKFLMKNYDEIKQSTNELKITDFFHDIGMRH